MPMFFKLIDCLSAPTMVRIEISCYQVCLVSRWETSYENQGKQKYNVGEHWVGNTDPFKDMDDLVVNLEVLD